VFGTLVINERIKQMKSRGFLSTLFAIMVLCAMQLTISTAAAASGSGAYSAQLISPTAGVVLHPGQQVMIQWTAHLPNVNLTGCEMEVWLHHLYYADPGPAGQILQLDCSEPAYQRGGPGYSLRLRRMVSGKLRTSACIDLCNRKVLG